VLAFVTASSGASAQVTYEGEATIIKATPSCAAVGIGAGIKMRADFRPANVAGASNFSTLAFYGKTAAHAMTVSGSLVGTGEYKKIAMNRTFSTIAETKQFQNFRTVPPDLSGAPQIVGVTGAITGFLHGHTGLSSDCTVTFGAKQMLKLP